MKRCVLITGASGGIGAAIAHTFAKQGDSVVLGYHTGKERAEALRQAIESAGGSCCAVQADIREESAVESMVRAAEQRFGAVQVLVNNAGIAQQKLFDCLKQSEWDDMFAVQARGAFLCAKHVLPQMLRAKSGCIINIASMWGQVGASCESHYASANAALIGLTKSLAKEEGPSGIRVNCVSPGAIDTGMMSIFSKEDKEALCGDIPLCRLGTAQDVANAVVFLASDLAAYITGQVLGVNGGMVM